MNDVAPMFTQPFGYAFAVAENLPVGTQLTTDVSKLLCLLFVWLFNLQFFCVTEFLHVTDDQDLDTVHLLFSALGEHEFKECPTPPLLILNPYFMYLFKFS